MANAPRPYGRYRYGTGPYQTLRLPLLVGGVSGVTTNAWSGSVFELDAGAVSSVTTTAYATVNVTYGAEAVSHVALDAWGVLRKNWDTTLVTPCEGGTWTPSIPCEQGAWAAWPRCSQGSWKPAKAA
jgi:hypothetical protein